ncbi:zona pellucida sperm-binding protein 3-like isoform X2 [Heteronotia binoei]|uniref:zona pellucida sperm-binding protein 3-like isoform X2 n=1 Tax=Heteronotia binoei TaxID=13085 RepID=UPI00292DE77B|nr:zona pellucida sperm-binding protein 3-like isoform X2 [Heteronotia binoei]
MGLSLTLGLAFLGWLLSGVVAFNLWDSSARNRIFWRPVQTAPPTWPPYSPSWPESDVWAWVDASQTRALSTFTPVSVKCGEAQVVVTVKRDLFGTGRLIQARDLSLGSSGCKYTSLDAVKEEVIFEAMLHECGSTLQMTPESLVYSITLFYKPTPASNAVVIRTSPAEVPIECHYPRKSNVSSKAILPTWIPFSSTLSAEQKLSFSLRLMNDDWSSERLSNRYQLGDVMNIQANVNGENHVALRLFVDNCVATMSPDSDSSPRYAIIDYHGCLVDGKSDSSATFLSPRVTEDSLRFTVDVFKFTGDSQDLYITCHLKVTAVEQVPDPVKKACSFSKASNVWIPVEGKRDICGCCETRNCGPTGGQSGRVNPWDRWSGGRRVGRDVAARREKQKKEVETDVTLGPIFLIDAYMASRRSLSHQSQTLEATEEQGSFSTPALIVGLVLMSIAMVLALTLAVLLLAKKHSSSP